MRALGPFMAISVVVGGVIGSGIFAKPSSIAQESGDFRLILMAWIAGGIYCLLGALCFAELAAMLPRAGGLYIYLREAYGRFIAFQFGFNEYMFGRPASIAALAVLFGDLASGAVGLSAERLGIPGKAAVSLTIAILTISLLTCVNVLGVVWGGRMQGLTTFIKAGFLIVFAILPFALTMAGYSAVQFSNFATTIAPRSPDLSTQFAAVLLSVMWAYNGWHDIAPVAEEVKDPQRNIPLSLIGGVLVLIAIYVGVNLAYHGVLTMEQIAGAGRETAQKTMTVALAGFGPAPAQWGRSILDGVALCSVFGALNANLMLGPRIAFAMARDRIFWRPLAFVHGRFRTPSTSILTQAGISVGLILGVTLLINTVPQLSKLNLFDLLTDMIAYSANIFYSLCVLAVFILRWRHPEWQRPYRTWGYPVVPILFLLMQLWFSYAVYGAKQFETLAGLGIIAIGVPAYLLASWGHREPEAQPAAIQ